MKEYLVVAFYVFKYLKQIASEVEVNTDVKRLQQFVTRIIDKCGIIAPPLSRLFLTLCNVVESDYEFGLSVYALTRENIVRLS